MLAMFVLTERGPIGLRTSYYIETSDRGKHVVDDQTPNLS